MTGRNNLSNKGLSEKAQDNLRRNAELRLSRRMKGNRLLILRDGDEIVRIFDPGQIDLKEVDYGDGEKVQKFDYTVTDPDTGEIEIFRVGIKTSGDIDALLIEGYLLLKVRREGSGKSDTRYYITPVKDS
jgi:hypothetical protein